MDPQTTATTDTSAMEDDSGPLMAAIANAGKDAANQNQPQQQETPKQEATKEAAKDEGAKQPKSLKERFKVQEPEQEETTEETTEEAEGDDEPQTYKGRVPSEKEKATWKGLRAIEKEYKSLKPQLEELQAKLAEYEGKKFLDDDVTKEIDELRKFRDMTDFKLSEKYQTEVLRPLEQIETDIGEIIETFSIDKDELAKAVVEKSEWKRNLAIDKVVEKLDDAIPAGVLQTLRDRASKMHDVWQKQAKMEDEAFQNKAAFENERKQAMSKKQLEEAQAWEKASSETTKMIEAQMGPLLKSLPEEGRKELMNALKEAKIADSPEERALQAQAPHLAAVLIEKLNEMQKELTSLKKQKSAITAAKPSTNGRQTEAKPKLDDDDDGEALMSAIARHNGR